MRAGASGVDDTSSEQEVVETLRRWEDFGAVWRVLDRDARQVTIGLFRCDGGEEVGRLVSDAPEVAAFVGEREAGGPAA